MSLSPFSGESARVCLLLVLFFKNFGFFLHFLFEYFAFVFSFFFDLILLVCVTKNTFLFTIQCCCPPFCIHISPESLAIKFCERKSNTHFLSKEMQWNLNYGIMVWNSLCPFAYSENFHFAILWVEMWRDWSEMAKLFENFVGFTYRSQTHILFNCSHACGSV